MKNRHFGYSNELDRATQERLARHAARADALIAALCIGILGAYALASWLDGVLVP